VDDVQSGAVFRAVRLRHGWSQSQAAAAAGICRSVVSSIERGKFEETSFRAARLLAASLGISMTVETRWRGAEAARLLDERHALLVRAVTGRLAALGWQPLPEHTFSIYGERGSIDVLGCRPADRAVVAVEVKTRLPDIQDLLVTMDRKRRLLRTIARAEGWSPLVQASVLVLPDETWARNAVRRFDPIFDAALPARTIEVRHWLKRPQHDLRGIWFLLDDGTGCRTRDSRHSMRVATRRPGARAACPGSMPGPGDDANRSMGGV
jgi:transcriptional regulator with XRE-family HTH domain